ncbi:LysR family transcriptional regulator [Pectinatus haikarae]|uniref:DNA-binding transcriptional LysR family regulator n=1 Tax=Pectinatus haikarae TaxID=349096 RepID=A0ABT9Y9L0_9FIRM|nr:LysR family transcriptional regulator [Pectinatus haikarae]MDQ0204180.1 DNA-binding transcriptional LysR family regulator [Pectinatus haikarae]
MEQLPSIQQLENFIIYGKVRNFTTAAKKANITQSAFSFQMKKLEELLGVKLIVRSNRGSDLTEAGEKFLQHVQKVIGELSECVYEMKQIKGKTMPLNIGALMSLGDVLMNQHLSYFQKHNADLTINVYNLEAYELFRQLEDGSLDIISTFYMSQLDVAKYERTFFCNEKMVFYAPHFNSQKNELAIEDIASYPLVQYAPHYLMNSIIKNYFTVNKKTPVVKAWLSTPYAIMNYCQQNETGAVLSERLLNAVGIEDGYYDMAPSFNLKCYLMYKKSNPKYKIMKVFIDYIQKLYTNR